MKTINFENQDENKPRAWKQLKRSQRISLVKEWGYVQMESLRDDQKQKYKALIIKNSEFREIADWSIINELTREQINDGLK